jgi:hypothetical protein
MTLRTNDNQNNDIQHKDTQHNNTQHNDIQYNDTQHIDTQHNNKKCETQHNCTLVSFLLRVVMLLVTYAVSKKHTMRYAECRNAKCRCAQLLARMTFSMNETA